MLDLVFFILATLVGVAISVWIWQLPVQPLGSEAQLWKMIDDVTEGKLHRGWWISSVDWSHSIDGPAELHITMRDQTHRLTHNVE